MSKGMTSKEFFEFHQSICNKAQELSKRKNNDYADPETRCDDPYRVFANFMQCQTLGVCSVESGILVRLSDKFSRLCNLLKPDHVRTVTNESIEDTILDIINYSILLQGYLTCKENVQSAKR